MSEPSREKAPDTQSEPDKVREPTASSEPIPTREPMDASEPMETKRTIMSERIEQHLEDGSANPEWLAARAGKFTGSRFADLMARTKSGPSTSRANLLATLAVERITGQCVEMFANAAMARGTELEPVARSAYESLREVLVEEVGFCESAELDCVGVSPDGLIGSDGLIEIKCPAAMAKHLEALRTCAHAVEYKWQVQGQLWVTDRAWCDVVSFDPRWPDGLQLAIHRVFRDEAAIAELRAECAKADAEVTAIVADLTAPRSAASIV